MHGPSSMNKFFAAVLIAVAVIAAAIKSLFED
jgi:hypothetical protein